MLLSSAQNINHYAQLLFQVCQHMHLHFDIHVFDCFIRILHKVNILLEYIESVFSYMYSHFNSLSIVQVLCLKFSSTFYAKT